jgi:ribonucleoside-diphosphate reductase beta chain
MRGNWGEVWDSFDKRKKKPANDADLSAEAIAKADGPDMSEQAGVAAE